MPSGSLPTSAFTIDELEEAFGILIAHFGCVPALRVLTAISSKQLREEFGFTDTRVFFVQFLLFLREDGGVFTFVEDIADADTFILWGFIGDSTGGELERLEIQMIGTIWIS